MASTVQQRALLSTIDITIQACRQQMRENAASYKASVIAGVNTWQTMANWIKKDGINFLFRIDRIKAIRDDPARLAYLDAALLELNANGTDLVAALTELRAVAVQMRDGVITSQAQFYTVCDWILANVTSEETLPL